MVNVPSVPGFPRFSGFPSRSTLNTDSGRQNQPLFAEQGRADPDGLRIQFDSGLAFNLLQYDLHLGCRPIRPMGAIASTKSATARTLAWAGSHLP